ncbi:MAG: AAA family ATPase [Myxococcota bacterium]
MSRPQSPAGAGRDPAGTAVGLPIGQEVLDIVDWAYRARRPLLLEGHTGIGKSQIVADYAAAAGLDLVVLDLSLLEPPDLVGLPVIEGGRTAYASPAELPTEGRGILVLEELNRAEIPVMQPALQLLSARQLHSYTLPDGWSCVAAINPEDGDYQVHRLDPALRSRFLQLRVTAERASWLDWATRQGVHPAVVATVGEHPDAFDVASPRSWTYASDLLRTLTPDESKRKELLVVALAGYLPVSWAMALAERLEPFAEPLRWGLDDLIAPDAGRRLAERVASARAGQRIDVLHLLASQVAYALRSPRFVGLVEAKAIDLATLETRLEPLPGDLRDQCLMAACESGAARALLAERGLDASAVLHDYRSEAAPVVGRWRAVPAPHLLRLLAVAVQQAAAETDPTPHLDSLGALISDLGPPADDLVRFLRARDLDPAR